MPRTGYLSNQFMTATATKSTTPNVAAIVQRAAELLLDHKANDVVLLSLDGVSDMTDYFLIASGTSDTHVRSLAQSLAADLKKELRQSPHHEEGVAQGRWALLDYVDFVVHVFHPTLRNFYQLERLWADAQVVPVTAAATR
jgi:ribosome-associated protein